MKEIKAELTGLDTKVKIDGVPTRETHDRIEALKAELASLNNVRVKLDVDASGASAKMKKVKAEIAALTAHDPTVTVKVKTEGLNFAGRGISNLTAALVALGPTTVPVLATVAAGIGTVGAAAAAAGGAVGIWGGVMAGALAGYKKDVTDLKALNKSLASATDPAKIKNLKGQIAVIKSGWSQDEKDFDVLKDKFTGAFQALVKASGPATFGVLNSGMRVLMGVMPRLSPIINATGHAVQGLIQDFGRFTKTVRFQGVLDFFQTHGPSAVTSFGHIIGNLTVGIGNLLGAFTPFQTSFLGGFEAMTRKFETWSAGFGRSGNFQRFMDYVHQTLPGVRDLFANLFEFAGKLLTALAPLGAVELGALNTLLEGLNSLSPRQLTVLAGGIGSIVLGLKAWAIASAAVATAEKIGIARAKLLGNTVETAGGQIETAGTRIGGIKGHLDTVKGAFAGLAGAAGIGLLLDGATRANNKMGTLETTMGGAAAGFAVGGPWGAAIGAGAGLLVGLASHFKDTSQAARDAFRKMQSTSVLKTVNRNLEDLKGTLDTVTGAYTDATRAAVLQKLQQSGALDVGKKYGITAREMVNSVLGQGAALSRLAPVMNNYHSKIAAIEHQQADLSVATDKYGNLLKIDVHGNLVKLSKSEQEHYNALEKTKRGYQAQADQLRRIGPQLHGYARNIQDSTAATADYTGKLKGIPKRVRSFIEANGIIPTAKGVADLAAKFRVIDKKKIKTLIEASGADATVKDVQRVIDRIHGIPAKFTSTAEFLAAKAKAATDSYREYVNRNQGKHNLLDRAAWNDQKARAANAAWKKYLNDNQGKHNLLDRATWDNKRAAQAALNWRIYVNQQRSKHNLLSPAVFEATKAKNDARSYQQYVNAQIAKVKNRTVDIKLSARAAQVLGTSRRQNNQEAVNPVNRATGGAVFGAGSATSDSIPAMLSNNEHVWTAREVAAAGGHGAVEAIRSSVLKGRGLALASGGAVVLTPKTQKVAVSTAKIDGYFGGLAQTIAAAVTRAAKATALFSPISGASKRTTMDGQAVSEIAARQIRLMERLSGVNFRVMQGGYGGHHIRASGTSHNYPGVVDLSPASIGYEKLARRVGFAAWARNIAGRGRVGSGAHIHAVSLLDPGDRNAPQVTGSWAGHRTGLNGGGHDPAPHYAWLPNLKKLLGFGAVSAAGGGSGSVRRIVEQAASRFGWGRGSEWNALTRIIQSESGWNPHAENSRSTASGLFQFVDGTARAYGLPGHASRFSVPAQAAAGMRYIRGRYGDPLNAWAYHRAHGTYANGGPVIGGGSGTSDSILARLSNGEHVWTAREVAGAGGHAAVQALRGYAKGGAATTAPASVTRQISAQITAMRNALDTSKFYQHLVPYIRRRLSGKQEETYLARAHKAFVSDLQRNAMDRIRSNTTALRHSDNPNRDYAALTAFIRRHLTGREERDRLRMAKEALTADKKRLATEQAHASATRARRLGGTTLNAIELGRGGSMATVIRHLADIIRQDFNGRRERSLLGSDRHLSRIQARSAAISDQLAAAQRTRSTLVGDRNTVRSTFAGFGPNIADYAQSPGGILGGLRGQLASVRKFTANIQRLRKLGYPNSIISQVIGLGLTDGIAASAQLIGLSRRDRANVISTFGRLDSVARSNGVSVSNQMYRGGVAAADAQIAHLKARQKSIDGVFVHAAEALARHIARLLHIPVVRVKPRATHDFGGQIPTGASLVVNNTGRPEAVYNAQQQAQHEEDRAMMRKLIARYESGRGTGGVHALAAGDLIVHETVDLQRLEQRQAFRERMSTV